MFDIHRFYTGAIVLNDNKELELRHFSVDDDYAEQMPEDWYMYYYNFIINKELINFKPGDDGDDHELVIIDDFKLPSYFNSFNKASNMGDFHSLRPQHMKPRTIKSIISSTSFNGKDLILFQKFLDSTQLGYGLKFSIDLNTISLNRVKEPSISFGTSIIGVCEIDKKNNKKLIFNRFSDLSYILDLYRYFHALSPQEIKTFLDRALFEYDEDELDEIIYKASDRLAKRFALVEESGILDRFTAEEFKSISLKYRNVIDYKINIELSTDRQRILFPSKKTDAHNILRFFNGDFYTDDFDGHPFLARGKRRLDT